MFLDTQITAIEFRRIQWSVERYTRVKMNKDRQRSHTTSHSPGFIFYHA